VNVTFGKYRGVFEDLFRSNGRFDAGKHFYDNAVIHPLRGDAIGKHFAASVY